MTCARGIGRADTGGREASNAPRQLPKKKIIPYANKRKATWEAITHNKTASTFFMTFHFEFDAAKLLTQSQFIAMCVLRYL